MPRPINTILIANRGEIALRIMRTCREMGIRVAAVYSEADRRAPHVLAADMAVEIGPAPSTESYLRIDRILDACRKTGADAVHPGYGFLSESSEFAQAVADAGLVFIGPSPAAIEAMGDKTRARALVKSAGVPIVPGTGGAVQTADEALAFAASHGYPVLLKAAAGGGGKGMRIVYEPGQMASALSTASSEAASAFGDGRVFLEKYIEKPRHIEFQIIGDTHGTIVHLGERECSIQRRHQKVVEETPSVVVDDALRAAMGATAVKAAQAGGYANAGTIEFLVDAGGRFYFLEMNTRLQVEHPVTELRTGLDLVALQIRVAAGLELPFTQEQLPLSGHAIECRLCAEDVENNYMPAAGTVRYLRPASGIGVREDRGVNEGDVISLHYDPMISKIVTWGSSRPAALARMRRALMEYRILGVRTNLPLLLFIMNHPRFISGEFDTHFLQEYFTPADLPRGSADGRKAAAILAALLKDAERTPVNGDAAKPRARKWKFQQREIPGAS